MKKHRSHKYLNLTLLVSSIILTIFLANYSPFQQILLKLGNFGYLGVFIAGFLFVCSFTISIGALILLTLSKQMPPLLVALIAGLGGDGR